MNEGETVDSICGSVRIIQREKGYRFNLDSVLLAAFAVEGLPRERKLRVIDLGTGSGIVALLVASWRPNWRVSAVDVQPAMVDLARRNATLNQISLTVMESDWRDLGTRGRAGEHDLVVCNPPYRSAKEGRSSPHPERATARTETHGVLTDAVRAAARCVRGNGTIRFIYPSARLDDLFAAFESARCGVVRMRFIHPRDNKQANAVLVEAAIASKRPIEVSAPLFVHGRESKFSPALERLLTGLERP